MTLPQTILSTRNLSTGYRHPRRMDSIITRGLNLELRRGELACLLGPNGAGKSTLMRTLAGMQPALDGTVLLDGHDVHALTPTELARQMSIVLTERVDAGNLSAYELVSLGRHPHTDWAGRLRQADHAVIEQSIAAVSAGTLRDRAVNELSDGERQKVMIARALAQEPTVMLLDEPTAFLDLPRRVEIMNMLRELARLRACAILLSTHDLDLALRNADEIWLLPNDGRMHVGMPEELVLNGAFAAAFHSEGVEFDSSRGTFKMRQQSRGKVALLGDGERAFWTGRALERLGFEVVKLNAESSCLQVHVMEQDGVPQWETAREQQRTQYGSLREMIAYLRASA